MARSVKREGVLSPYPGRYSYAVAAALRGRSRAPAV